MTYLHVHAKVQGQRPVGSEDRVETNGRRTDGGDCITFHANAAGKNLTLKGLQYVYDLEGNCHGINCRYSIGQITV